MIYLTLFTLTQRTEFYELSGNKTLHHEAQVVEAHTFVYVNHVYNMGRKYLCYLLKIFDV